MAKRSRLNKWLDSLLPGYDPPPRGLDSFDVLPPVGIPQPPIGEDGVVRLALPEDYED